MVVAWPERHRPPAQPPSATQLDLTVRPGCPGMHTQPQGAAKHALRVLPCPQEAVKLNQCRGVWIEGCDISGARDNAVDMVAVQVSEWVWVWVWAVAM